VNDERGSGLLAAATVARVGRSPASWHDAVMRTLPAFLGAAALLAGGGLPAQTLTSVSPKIAVGAGATTPGVSGLGFGFGLNAHRLQQVHNYDSFTTGQAQPLSIRSINFRMPKGYNTGNQGGQTVEVEMHLAYAKTGVTATALSSDYDANPDAGTRVRVFAKKSVKLPVLGTPTNPSLGFDFKLPFDSGKSFLFLPTRQLSLVFDIWNFTYQTAPYTFYVDGWTHARSGLTAPIEASLVYGIVPPATGFGVSGPNGTYAGCPTRANKNATHTTDGRTLVKSAYHDWEGDAFVATLPGALVVGANALDATLPGTTCKLMQDLLIVDPLVTDASGHALLTWAIPPLPLVGVTLLSQMAFLDPQANALGIVTSNGLKSVFGAGVGTAAVTQGRSLIVEFSN
jgi:hypothetical protein